MFNKRTVFIVGAGASAECSLPTGTALKDGIATGLRWKWASGELISGDDNLLTLLREKANNDKEQLKRLTTASMELAQTIGTFPSIDEALHWWRERPEIVEIGKLAIAHHILSAERRSPLNLDKYTGRVDVDHASGTWLPHFFSMVLSGLARERAGNAFENVTVINFNYDRTLEQYLFNALQQRAGVSAESAKDSVAALKVIRPYGSLGLLPWQDKSAGIDFGDKVNPANIVPNIRTFTEQVEGPGITKKIDAELMEAELVVFLGFGFHQQNMQLLAPQSSSRRHVKAVFATTFGIDNRNEPAIQTRLNAGLAIQPLPTLVDLTSSQLLEKLRLSLSMFAS